MAKPTHEEIKAMLAEGTKAKHSQNKPLSDVAVKNKYLISFAEHVRRIEQKSGNEMFERMLDLVQEAYKLDEHRNWAQEFETLESRKRGEGGYITWKERTMRNTIGFKDVFLDLDKLTGEDSFKGRLVAKIPEDQEQT